MYRVLEATVAYATLICTFYYYYYYYYCTATFRDSTGMGAGMVPARTPSVQYSLSGTFCLVIMKVVLSR